MSEAKRFYPCWCDGEDGCEGPADKPFGLCPTCIKFRHGRLPRMGFTDEDMESMAVDASGRQERP